MPDTPIDPSADWEALHALIEAGDAAAVIACVRALPPGEVAYTISHLPEDEQVRLLEIVPPDLSADLMAHLDDTYAADIIEDLKAEQAAAIVDVMDSDEQADILSEMEDADAQAILREMSPDEASDVRERLEYASDTAGGIMITEYLVYTAESRIHAVLDDLREHQEKFANYVVQFVYVVNAHGQLRGVVRLQDLVLGLSERPIASIMRDDAVSVRVDQSVDELDDQFDHSDLNALPVVDAEGVLHGVVRRAHVEEAQHERADRSLARFGGIIRGDEIRSMPLLLRCARRLAFLVPNIFLMLVSISIITAFEEAVMTKVITLAAFLPLIAGVSGCSGNQAVAVSIREISLGLAKPNDVLRVLRKEAGLGFINGCVIGIILFAITAIWGRIADWTGPYYLAMVVGGSAPLTVFFSVVFGGTVPLVLSRFSIDPAMASGPILTTLVDFFSFLTVLSLAWLALAHLT